MKRRRQPLRAETRARNRMKSKCGRRSNMCSLVIRVILGGPKCTSSDGNGPFNRRSRLGASIYYSAFHSGNRFKNKSYVICPLSWNGRTFQSSTGETIPRRLTFMVHPTSNTSNDSAPSRHSIIFTPSTKEAKDNW